MFGRDLTEQATADNPGRVYLVPHIVDKCIEAVEASGKTNKCGYTYPTNDVKLLIMKEYIARTVVPVNHG